MDPPGRLRLTRKRDGCAGVRSSGWVMKKAGVAASGWHCPMLEHGTYIASQAIRFATAHTAITAHAAAVAGGHAWRRGMTTCTV